MNTSKWTQKVLQGRPDTFNGICVDFTDTISISISRPFTRRLRAIGQDRYSHAKHLYRRGHRND